MEFLFWWKKVRAFLKKLGGGGSGLGNVVLFFVASIITSLGLDLALRTSRAIPLANCSAELIPARQFTLFVP